MKLVFDERAWEDYLHWQATDAKLLARLNLLIRECARTPFAGTGKPEPLRGALSGWWSRRLTREHRLVYRVSDDSLSLRSAAMTTDRDERGGAASPHAYDACALP